MVELSLRKARNNWKQISSPTKTKTRSRSPANGKFKSNPYQNLTVPSNYSELPQIGTKERNRVGTSMQRRLSFHNPKYVPPSDYSSVPLPQLGSSSLLNVESSNMQARSRSNSTLLRPQQAEVRGDQSLRQILSDSSFKAKEYVAHTLGNASALEIDRFTSELNDLSLEVSDEIKENINRSYAQVLQVNKDLDVASIELKQLRSSISDLEGVMGELESMAEKKLQLERGQANKARPEQASLMPPTKTPKARDRTSVLMLEKMWNNELAALFKSVEGAQKFISPLSGRHILMEAADWYEINAATLKPLRAVHIFVLNDMIMVAARNQDKKQHDLIACHCHALRDTNIDPQKDNRIGLYFSNRNQCLIQTQKTREYDRFVSIVRGAKDDLNVISQAEKENARRLRDSFSYLQATQQTPGRGLTLSPTKGHTRNSSLGNNTARSLNDSSDNYLLQTIAATMQPQTRFSGVELSRGAFGRFDNDVEDFDIVFARHDYREAIHKIESLNKFIQALAKESNQDNYMVLNLLQLKVTYRNQLLTNKLTQLASTETFDFSKLVQYVQHLLLLGYSHDALELFLQNRSKYIHELILKVGSTHNPVIYLTQISVIRFQTLKKVVSSVQELFKNTDTNFSSALVSWCDEEVDKHFALINKQFLNLEAIPPSSIKSSRRQIDDLKSVGLDFVYKLDDFIRRNSQKIG
ncbi:exocyst subunit EXO84 [Lachancea thermotolerans CBS 6340]|uniref:Exocyst complex component EXO84 n=1 Tax=Lachancea thermotolerans (strain ATCC 56472 / CBS 6340 / NRRL Y-8284) TaxID=559295 RepID=C5DIT9_LACTC|nr:KLTH0E15136p [Lachancea thermotolerans CBS 6340]CAR23700.1 KLTH0E15136p [Lachancea thermotolerans CBS 6340]